MGMLRNIHKVMKGVIVFVDNCFFFFSRLHYAFNLKLGGNGMLLKQNINLDINFSPFT